MNEKQYKNKLADLGCMVCRRLYDITDSPVQLHHLRTGGWGKGDYKTLIPLCPEHHTGKSGIHGMGTKGFDIFYEKHGFSQIQLLIDAQKLMQEYE
jgi:hypothetical protein